VKEVLPTEDISGETHSGVSTQHFPAHHVLPEPAAAPGALPDIAAKNGEPTGGPRQPLKDSIAYLQMKGLLKFITAADTMTRHFPAM
jgi:hypothetical protein